MPEGSFSAADEVRPWGSLNDEEKAMFSRMAEVYAGFSEYTGYGFDFRGGSIAQVVFDIADDAYLDLEAHLAAAMARD